MAEVCESLRTDVNQDRMDLECNIAEDIEMNVSFSVW